MLNALGRFFKRGASGEEKDPMAFLDEYAAVMNQHTRVKVRNGFRWGRAGLSIDDAFSESAVLWLEDGQYCFDEEERGKIRRGGFFSSPSVELTQKVMVNYTVSILRHSLGLPVRVFRRKLRSSRWGGPCIRQRLLVTTGWMVLMGSVLISRRELRPTVWLSPGSTT